MKQRIKNIVRRRLSPSELRDIRARENREGTPYSDRDMLLDHIEVSQYEQPVAVLCECGQKVWHAQWCRAVPQLYRPADWLPSDEEIP